MASTLKSSKRRVVSQVTNTKGIHKTQSECLGCIYLNFTRFGHASVPIDEFYAYREAIETLVNEKEWKIVIATLSAGILPDEDKVKKKLEFGDLPHLKKERSKMIKNITKGDKNADKRNQSAND